MGLISCPKTLRNYQYLLHNNPEERKSQKSSLTVVAINILIYEIKGIRKKKPF
jgi:hypothetical protein